MTSPNDDSAKLAAVRAVFSAFDWEHDDRQYALEEIERIVTAVEDDRTAFIAGLRDLADYLSVHPDVPTPRHLSPLNVFPEGTSSGERRAAVDAAAAVFGAATLDRGNGHYLTEREFGPVTYCVITIDGPAPVPYAVKAA
jgi:hypothetical protein